VNAAETPFEFVTVSYLTRIANQSAGTLRVVNRVGALRDASFFITPFKRWEPSLSDGRIFERFRPMGCFRTRTGTGPRRTALPCSTFETMFRSRRCAVICACGSRLLHHLSALCDASPRWSDFIFARVVEVTVPLGRNARTLDEFRYGIAHLSHAGFYFSFYFFAVEAAAAN